MSLEKLGSLFAFSVVFCLLLNVGIVSSNLGEAHARSEEEKLLEVKQDLMPFAQQVGPQKLLLSPEVQAKRNARSDEHFFGPWSLVRPSVSPKQFRHMILKKAKGFVWEKPWESGQWQKLVLNTNSERYPSPQGPAIVTTHADLRSMPTSQPLFLEPTPVPAVDFFDFFQLASLAQGTPVYISHASRDNDWVYVEYALLSGWVRAENVALVSREFVKTYKNRPLAVAVRDRLPLSNGGGKNVGMAHVGSVFPWAEAEGGAVFVPTRAQDGKAVLEKVQTPQGSMLSKPLPLTAEALALLGNEMLGQPYAWGGSGQNRDCSLAMRDLFLPFGIWLPRNSRTQADAAGEGIKLDKLPPEARKAKIVHEGKAFQTLLGFPGHVGLYVGLYKGKPIMLHNILGLRTDNEDEWYRRIIGKCILSSLEPGKDMPEVQLSETLLERLRVMRVLD